MLSSGVYPQRRSLSFYFKGIGMDKYAENSASETIYLQSIVYK